MDDFSPESPTSVMVVFSNKKRRSHFAAQHKGCQTFGSERTQRTETSASTTCCDYDDDDDHRDDDEHDLCQPIFENEHGEATTSTAASASLVAMDKVVVESLAIMSEDNHQGKPKNSTTTTSSETNNHKDSSTPPKSSALETYAQQRLETVCPKSGSFVEKGLAVFQTEELKVGKLLGNGRFCAVNEIKGISLVLDDPASVSTSSTSEAEQSPRQTIAQHCSSSAGEEVSPFVLKRLPPKLRAAAAAAAAEQNSGNCTSSDASTTSSLTSGCYEDDEDDDDDDYDGFSVASSSSSCSTTSSTRKDAEALLWAGMIDLATETRFLSQLHYHPHIVQLHGVSADKSLFSPDHFILLDRLQETLQARIRGEWKTQLERLYKKSQTAASSASQSSSSQERKFLGLFGKNKKKNFDKNQNSSSSAAASTDFLKLRLQAALDLGSAIEYLHSKGICHRDVKPDNVGFDMKGTIKIFDFGLARQLPLKKKKKTRQDGKNDEPTYMLSRMTGTLRYMAPEVALGRPYNTKCDVYSYSLVLWQMLTLQRRPFGHYNDYSHFDSSRVLMQNVHVGTERPPLVAGGGKDDHLSRSYNSFVLGRQLHHSSSTRSSSLRNSMGRSNSGSSSRRRRGLKWTLSKGCKETLQGGWDANVQQRWTMQKINEKLKTEVARLEGHKGWEDASSSVFTTR